MAHEQLPSRQFCRWTPLRNAPTGGMKPYGQAGRGDWPSHPLPTPFECKLTLVRDSASPPAERLAFVMFFIFVLSLWLWSSKCLITGISELSETFKRQESARWLESNSSGWHLLQPGPFSVAARRDPHFEKTRPVAMPCGQSTPSCNDNFHSFAAIF